MATLVDSGSQTTSGTTEHTLSSQTTDGTYVLAVDLSTMALGDIVELSLKTKIVSGGSLLLAYHATFGPGLPAEPISYSIPVPITEQWVATLKKAVGSDSAFPWAVILV